MCVCVCVNEAVTGSATAAAIHGDRLGLEANEGVDRQRHRVGNWKLYGWEFHALLPNELGLMSDNNNNNSNSNNRCNRKTAAKSETHRWNDPSRKQMRGAARMRHGLAPPTLIEMAQPAITTPIIIISRDGNKFPITICTAAAAAVIIKKSFFLIKITNWEDWTVKLIDPARKFASTLTAWIINWPILGRWGGYVSRNPRPHPLITSDETPAKLKSDPIFKKKKNSVESAPNSSDRREDGHRIRRNRNDGKGNEEKISHESELRAVRQIFASDRRWGSSRGAVFAVTPHCAQSGKYSQAPGAEALPGGQFSR